jgi:hypothetical protein
MRQIVARELEGTNSRLYNSTYSIIRPIMLRLSLVIYTFVLKLAAGPTAIGTIVGQPDSRKIYQESKEEQVKEIGGETHEIEGKVFVDEFVRIVTLESEGAVDYSRNSMYSLHSWWKGNLQDWISCYSAPLARFLLIVPRTLTES